MPEDEPQRQVPPLQELRQRLQKEVEGQQLGSAALLALSDLVTGTTALYSLVDAREKLVTYDASNYELRVEYESELRIAEQTYAIHEARVDDRRGTIPYYTGWHDGFVSLHEDLLSAYGRETNVEAPGKKALEDFRTVLQQAVSPLTSPAREK